MAKELRNTKTSNIQYTALVEDAKVTAIALMDGNDVDAEGLFFETDLEKIEKGIKKLNEFSQKCWLVSAVTLYALVYDQELYTQSGLPWDVYISQANERFGLSKTEISEQLSSARFFIQHHESLKRLGWNPVGSARKLARAELALELSNDLNATLDHLVKDSWADFNAWYRSFKTVNVLRIADKDVQDSHLGKSNIEIKDNLISIDGKAAVTISNDLDEDDKYRINGYIKRLFETVKAGYEPAIIPVYDNKEADKLLKYRDKQRLNS